MSRNRFGAAILVLGAALSAAPAAIAAGGGGGGGGNPCTPLTMSVKLPHADGNGNTGINVQATIRNCTAAPEPLRLDVTVPNSGTVPFKFTGGVLQPGGALTMFASPIGSTPSALHFGQTYTVIASLTKTGPTPTILSRLTATVTMPLGPIA
jgi:hypothetical protein